MVQGRSCTALGLGQRNSNLLVLKPGFGLLVPGFFFCYPVQQVIKGHLYLFNYKIMLSVTEKTRL